MSNRTPTLVMNVPDQNLTRTAQPPKWLMTFLRFGLSIFRPFLPPVWMEKLEHAALFIFMGVMNQVLAYLVYVGLLNVFDLHRQWALLGAYFAGIFIGYYNFSRFVFDTGTRHPFARFVAAYIALYFVNRALLEIVVRAFGLTDEMGQLVLLVPVALISYAANRFIVFRGGAGR